MYITKEEYSLNHNKYFTLDVRTPVEFEVLPKLDNSVNAEIDVFLKDYKSILEENNPEDKEIVVVCNVSVRSTQAANFLIEKGYKVKVLEGGISHYTNQKIR